MLSNMVYMGVLVNALFVHILILVTKFFQGLFAQENVMGHSINNIIIVNLKIKFYVYFKR